MGDMLELEEAQAKLLALAPQMPVRRVSVADAQGYYLANELLANRTQPSRDLSAMDGYAITGGTGPWSLVGESRAGARFEGKLGTQDCVRISTGAAMPEGSDRVLIQENSAVEGNRISIACDPPASGQHVRRRGMDFTEGDRLLAAGTRLGPAQIALAVSGGQIELEVCAAPKVAVLDSGDELAADPSQCGPDQIPASNGVMLAAMLKGQGCDVEYIGPVPDDREALAMALAQVENADFVVTSGGASVGDHDLIKPCLEEWGAELAFWKVAIKPGKPLIVATRGDQVVLGLPGNPVSSFVTAFLFLLPLVRKAMGAADPLPLSQKLPIGSDIASGGGRREFLRAIIENGVVQPLKLQDSSALANLARADCLIDRPAHAPAAMLGETVTVYPL